jgi:hypothetical protein
MKKKVNISDKALELISKGQIKPIPRWEFVARNWGLWLAFLVSLGFLILGISVSWFGLRGNIITPHLWLVIVVIFLGLSFVLFEKTKRAYRFQSWQVIAMISVIGLIVGGVVFKLGLPSRIDRRLEAGVPYYRTMVPMKMTAWNNPEQGYLSGKIVEINNDNFLLEDFEDKTWVITGKPLIRGRVEIKINQEVKLIGNMMSENVFVAEELRPWSGNGRNMMKEN